MHRRRFGLSLVTVLAALTLAVAACSPTRGATPVTAPPALAPAAPSDPGAVDHPPAAPYPPAPPYPPASPPQALVERALADAAAALAAVLAAADPIAPAPALAAALDRAAAALAEAAGAVDEAAGAQAEAAAADPAPELAPLLAACARVLSAATAAVAAAGELDPDALPAAVLALRRQGEVAAAVAAETAAALQPDGQAAAAAATVSVAARAGDVASLAGDVAARLAAAVDEALARLRQRYLAPLPGDRVAYLTFDDGPGAQTTPRILDVLAAEGVPATFFVIGARAAAHPDLIRRMAAAGHAVGNHTYNHHYPDIYPDPGQFLAALAQADGVLAPLLGQSPRLVRAPGGSYNKFTRRHLWLLEAAGYVAFDWNVDSEDAKGATDAAAIAARVAAFAGSKPVLVILLHDADGKDATVAALPRIIAGLREQGYAFATLDPNGPGLSQAAGRLLAAPRPAGP